MTEPPALPLFAWEDARAEQRRLARRRRHRACRIGFALALGCAPLIGTILVPPLPRLVWNASASAPVGLYLVTPGTAVRRHDRVLAWLPERARRLAARRGYLPADVPALKRVAALPGAQVCGSGAYILIDGGVVAARRVTDGEGRPLPWWQGCRTLRPGELFLLTSDRSDSFDGRYAGVSRASDVIGVARPVWLRARRGPRP